MAGTKTAQIRFEKVATDRGTYWRSKDKAPAIRSHLRDLGHTGQWKTAAAVGGSTEGDFEQAFSSLGYAYLKDKAPRLVDYMIGFQLVDRNEDNTKAVGIFGFQVGDQWLYAPIFFLNGDLKGHELLYIKKQDTFVPMKENWVNYVMSRKPHILGEPSPQDTYQMGGLSPDIYSMSLSPSLGIGKRGFDEWVKPVMPLVAAMHLKYANALYRSAKPRTKLAFDQVIKNPYAAALAEVAGSLDLNNVIPQHLGLLKNAFYIAEHNPLIKQGFDRFYGRDCFSRWAKEYRDQAAMASNNVMPVKQASAKPSFTGGSLIPDVELPEHPIKLGELKVYDDVAITKNLDELDDAEREKLLKDTVLIKDKRDPHGPKASKAYNTQVPQKMVNPHESGLYEVLEKPGSFARMLVISNPLSNTGQQDFCTLVRIGDSSTKSWLNAHRTALWADKIELNTEYRKWFEGLGDKSSLKKGGMYMAINEAGNGTVPFVVKETYEDSAYKVDFKQNCDYSNERAPGLPKIEQTSYPCDRYVSPWGAKLYVEAEGKAGTKLRALQGELRVPASFKFLKLKDPPKPKKEDGFLMGGCCAPSCDSDSGSEDRPIEPGKLEDIQMLFTEKTARLKIYDDHSEVSLSTNFSDTQRMTKRAAFISLIRDHGFTESVARELLKTAAVKGAQTFRVKYAPGFGNQTHLTKSAYAPNQSSLDGGPGAPYFQPPAVGMEQVGRNAVRSQYPSESHTMVPELDSTLQDMRHRNMWQNYTYEDFQQSQGQAQEAAQTGQKEVFDTSMINGLLKTVRQDTSIDRHLGKLMKALDSLGRLLFLFFWHQEEWEDRYGKADMPELEDSLRNSFEGLGDVVLFLKEKQVEPSWENNPSEPELEESARI